MAYDKARPKGFKSWNPRTKTRAILEQVQDVLATYEEHLPLTLRQIFYRLVASYDYDKTEQAYARLGEYLNRARRARIIPFDAMRDDGWVQQRPNGFSGMAGFWESVRGAAKNYYRDKQERQKKRLIILVEAAGMIPQVERVAFDYGVSVASSSGFDSLTIKKAMADAVEKDGRPSKYLHVGDLDPSGVCIFDSVAADVEAFVAPDDELLDGKVEFERIALTSEQVRNHGLPTKPPKKNDRRGNGIDDTCQAEALPPDVLATIIREKIESDIDLDIYREDCRVERIERRELVETIDNWNI